MSRSRAGGNRRETTMMRGVPIVAVLFFSAAAAMPEGVDISALWDFRNPEVSEERFRAALESAVGDDALILHTQIARTYVLRQDFEKAREVLRAVESGVEAAGPKAQVRFWLELGRTHASHQHPPESQTAESKELARAAYKQALDVAEGAELDGLAIDALHMFPFVDTDPEDQLRWVSRALATVEASDQPEAKRWEASVRNNLGEALYELGRYDEALGHFEKALTLREQESSDQATRNARWHVARSLRALNRIDEALAIQLRLERESDAAGEPRSWVFEELEILHRLKGDEERARHYADLREAIKQQN